MTEQDFPIAFRKTCEAIAQDCIACGLCEKDCRYLQSFGLPGEQAQKALSGLLNLKQVFSCSLCGLCTTVCPKDIDPAFMFAGLHQQAVREGEGIFKEHKGLIGYEKWGSSQVFSWYGLPAGCETVFFPGCALPGTRPDRVLQLMDVLRKQIPDLGIVLDCCTKSSHDLGRMEYFFNTFEQMKKTLLQQGIRRVLVACPSCYKIFARYGEGLKVQTIYEILAGIELPRADITGEVTVHDPCSIREQLAVHVAVRKLLAATGLEVTEMKHHGTSTVCCGEGGAVHYLNRGFAENWSAIRAREANGRRIITYCAGCTHFLSQHMPTNHVLDLLFDGKATINDKVLIARSPFTWLNRLQLKRRLKKKLFPQCTGRRGTNGEILLQQSGELHGQNNQLNRKRQRKAEKMYQRYRRVFFPVAEIEPEEALELQSEGRVVFVDVRDPDEQAISMLPGALSQEEFLAVPLPVEDAIIVCYCTIGYRSGLFVREHGGERQNMRNLCGGLLLWLHAGGLMERDGKVIRQAHVYGSKWALQPIGYLPVFKADQKV